MQTVGWIRMTLGMVVRLVSGHIVLDGNPAPQKGAQQPPSPIFGPCLLWRNGWMDQDTTLYGGQGDIALDGDPSPPKRGHTNLPHFHVYCRQTTEYIRILLGTDDIVLGEDPLPQKVGTATPTFRPISIAELVAKRLDGSRCHLVEVCLGQGDFVLDGDPRKAHSSSPLFGPYLLSPNDWIHLEFGIPLGMEVGLGTGHILLDGDPVPPWKGVQQPPLFVPRLLCPNGWTDQEATWYGGRHPLRRHCVRDPALPREMGTAATAPTFRPSLLWHGRPSQQLLSSC